MRYGRLVVLGILLSLAIPPITAQSQPAGLIARWTADNTGNDAAGTNHGALTGVTYDTGKNGQAFKFTTTGQYITVQDAPALDITSQITIDAWINPTEVNSNAIIEKGNACAHSGNYNVLLSGGKLAFQYHDGVGSDTWYTSTGTVTPNQWSHIAVTYDYTSGNIAFYINGQNVGGTRTQGTVDGPPLTTNNPLHIGNYFAYVAGGICPGTGPDNGGAGSITFKGLLDEVRIFNRVLNADEVKAAYDALTCAATVPPAPTAGLVSRWSAEGNGNDIISGNHAYPEGSVSYTTGVKGQAFNLGGGGWLAAGEGTGLALTSFTLAAWARTTSNGLMRIVDRAPGGYGILTNYQLGIYDGYASFSAHDGASSAVGAGSAGRVNDGTFHHLVATYDAATRQAAFYVDGKLHSTGANTGGQPYNGPGNFKIAVADGWAGGGIYPAVNIFVGALDEIAVYNRALNANEAQALCAAEGGIERCNVAPADCPAPASCTDGIQNQGETEVDCGGPCSTCTTTSPTPQDPRPNQTSECVPR